MQNTHKYLYNSKNILPYFISTLGRKIEECCTNFVILILILLILHQNFPSLKLIEIVMMWVYYTIPYGFTLFWHFLVITFQHFILHVWLRITGYGSEPEILGVHQ